MKRRLAAICALAGFFASPAAFGQGEFETEVSGRVTAVAGLSDGGTDDGVDVNAKIKVVGSTVFDNGLEIGAGAKARLDGDAPLGGLAGGRISGAQPGGTRGLGPEDGDLYAEQAYLYALSGFGRVIVGRDDGVGRKLAVTSPNIFSSVSVNDWETDLTRLMDIHTVNDFSNQATKFTYMAPAGIFGGAIGNVSLGLSYTPNTDVCGEAYCLTADGGVTLINGDPANPLPVDMSWDDILEYALYYENAFGDLSFGVAASYMTAEESTGNLAEIFDDYEAYSLGLNLAFGGFTLGGSVKNTNGGFAEADEDGYLAYDAGITYETGGWGFMFGYGNSDAGHEVQSPLDLSLYRQTKAYQTGVSFAFGPGITLGAAAQFVESEKPDVNGGEEEAAAFVFESSIRF